MIGPAIVAGLGAAGQFASGIMSAKARRAEFDQQIRETRMKMYQTVGTINARASAGGFELGSASTKDYLRATTNEFFLEISRLKRAQKQTFAANILGSLSGLLGSGAGIAGNYLKANPPAPSIGSGPFDISPFSTAPGGSHEGYT
jgi:hypothetical protein